MGKSKTKQRKIIVTNQHEQNEINDKQTTKQQTRQWENMKSKNKY